MHSGEVGALVGFYVSRAAIKIVHAEQRRAFCARIVADRKNLLEVVAAVVFDEETPFVGRKQFQVHHQQVVLDLQTFGQGLGVVCLLGHSREKQRH
ncbi:hypothetical protein D3C78_1398860 [compost metagenome]